MSSLFTIFTILISAHSTFADKIVVSKFVKSSWSEEITYSALKDQGSFKVGEFNCGLTKDEKGYLVDQTIIYGISCMIMPEKNPTFVRAGFVNCDRSLRKIKNVLALNIEIEDGKGKYKADIICE